MNKKILMSLGAALAVVASVAAMSAYEAHVINVTAHIENSLYVHPDEIAFGTVFPQEYLERQFTVELSDSFMTAERVDDVEYVIKQNPKCKRTELCPPIGVDPDCSLYAPVDYATHECPDGYAAMETLCPFLSKIDGDPEDNNDTSHLSYYDDNDTPEDMSDDSCIAPERYTGNMLRYSSTGWGGHSCPEGMRIVAGGTIGDTFPTVQGVAKPGTSVDGVDYPVLPHYTYKTNFIPPEEGYAVHNGQTAQDIQIWVDCIADNPDATGMLTKEGQDILDLWILDLKVPPVDGFVGQDWPAGCPTVPENDIDYGCDLWIEVTNISETPPPPEPFCGDGIVNGTEECEFDPDCSGYPDEYCDACMCYEGPV